MTLPAAAQRLIDRHQLSPHPEGGWYRETWRAAATVATPFGERPAGTSILYLIAGTQGSALHRLNQDEVWSYHAGPGLDLHVITDAGAHRHHRLAASAAHQAVVPAGAWQGATASSGWALVGCVCAPGFAFSDLVLARRDHLLDRYPSHATLIHDLARP